jgi:hypothetical protein
VRAFSHTYVSTRNSIQMVIVYTESNQTRRISLFRFICMGASHIYPYDDQRRVNYMIADTYTSRLKYSGSFIVIISPKLNMLTNHKGPCRPPLVGSNVAPDVLAQRWGASLDVATHTLKMMTQRGARNLLSPLTLSFRTRKTHMSYAHLRTNVYSDTLFSVTTSARHFTCDQLFIADQDLTGFFLMWTKANAPYMIFVRHKSFQRRFLLTMHRGN